MLKRFTLWFILLWLSFLLENWGLAEQGKVFLHISIGIHLAYIAIMSLLTAVLVILLDDEDELLDDEDELLDDEDKSTTKISFHTISTVISSLVLTLFASWGINKLFSVDFYVAYQIMTLGQCFCLCSLYEED